MDKLLFFGKNNRVKVKVASDGLKNRITYHRGLKKQIAFNQDADCNEYPVIVSSNYLERFLEINKIPIKTIKIDQASLKRFYQLEIGGTVTVAELTPSIVSKWWGYDCPDLILVEPNLEENDYGTCYYSPYYESRLVCWDDGGTVSDDITEEEADRLAGDKDNTIANRIRLKVSMRKATKLQRDSWLTEIVCYENQAQKIIDDNAGVIEAAARNAPQGLCGWLTYQTSNVRISNLLDKLAAMGCVDREQPNLHIRIPSTSMYLDADEAACRAVNELIVKEMGDHIWHRTYYD